MRAAAIATFALGTMLTLPAATALAGQGGSMVIIETRKGAPKLYHVPGCPEVKAESGVAALNRSQAESRGYKPHPLCTTAGPGGPSKEEQINQSTVYIAPGNNKYHLKDCPELPKGATETTVEKAAQKHWPCNVCKPPRRQRVKS